MRRRHLHGAKMAPGSPFTGIPMPPQPPSVHNHEPIPPVHNHTLRSTPFRPGNHQFLHDLHVYSQQLCVAGHPLQMGKACATVVLSTPLTQTGTLTLTLALALTVTLALATHHELGEGAVYTLASRSFPCRWAYLSSKTVS